MNSKNACERFIETKGFCRGKQERKSEKGLTWGTSQLAGPKVRVPGYTLPLSVPDTFRVAVTTLSGGCRGGVRTLVLGRSALPL